MFREPGEAERCFRKGTSLRIAVDRIDQRYPVTVDLSRSLPERARVQGGAPAGQISRQIADST